DVQIGRADRLEIVDARDRHARLHVRMRQRHRRQMSAGRPARRDEALAVAAECGQFARKKIDAGMDLGDDLIQRGIGRERIADQRDIDAVAERALGKHREVFLGAVLPIAAVDEQQGRRIVMHLEKVDAVALARTVTKIEMIGMALAQFRRLPLPARHDLAAAGHRLAIVETAVEIGPAQFAPVRRVKRRRHANPLVPCVATAARNVLDHLARTKYRRGIFHWLARNWCGTPPTRSSASSRRATSRRSTCSTYWKNASVKSMAP